MISEQAKNLQRYCQNAEVEKIADHYGLQHQLSKTDEELIELILAIQDYAIKLSSKDDDISVSHMVEEMAGVSIMIEQLTYLTESKKEFEMYRELKIKRQIGRIAEENQ